MGWEIKGNFNYLNEEMTQMSGAGEFGAESLGPEEHIRCMKEQRQFDLAHEAITKSCPFCGTPARAEDAGYTANSETLWNDSEVIRRGGRSYSVLCRKCGARGPESTTEKEAIKVWNNAKWAKD